MDQQNNRPNPRYNRTPRGFGRPPAYPTQAGPPPAYPTQAVPTTPYDPAAIYPDISEVPPARAIADSLDKAIRHNDVGESTAVLGMGLLIFILQVILIFVSINLNFYVRE